jgi:ubiquinone/menaquinone biosynthesis C-methylase UbiE
MTQMLKFDEAAARRLQVAYMTPDVVAQRRQTLTALALRPGEKVVDIGTGPGYLAASMAREVGAKGKVVAVDASENMLAVARASCAELAWVEFHATDAAQLPATDGALDVAVSTQVYEYVQEIDQALAEANRVLRSGGRIVIVDTDWDSIVWATSDDELTARLLRVFDEHLADPHLPRTLGERLRRAGFEVDSVAAIPIVNTAFDETVYSFSITKLIADFVTGRQGVTESDVARWRDDLQVRNREGRYFFSLNRYLFAAHKP